MSELLASQTDEALMSRVAAGHHDAFEVLLNRYERELVTFCYSFIQNREQARDLAQEVFLRVYRSAPRYKPVARFTTWLYRIAANLCINESKKNRLRRSLRLDDPAGPDPDGTRIIERMASPEGAPPSEAELREGSEIIGRAIDALPDDQRATLVMVEYHGLPYRDIAEILGISVSAVKMRVKRGRESLRAALRLSLDAGERE